MEEDRYWRSTTVAFARPISEDWWLRVLGHREVIGYYLGACKPASTWPLTSIVVCGSLCIACETIFLAKNLTRSLEAEAVSTVNIYRLPGDEVRFVRG